MQNLVSQQSSLVALKYLLIIFLSSCKDIITWPLPLSSCLGNGRLFILMAPSWNKISPALYFSSKIILKLTHCSRIAFSFMVQAATPAFQISDKEKKEKREKGREKFNLKPTNNTIFHLLLKESDSFLCPARERWKDQKLTGLFPIGYFLYLYYEEAAIKYSGLAS